jgi:hypothetical protein
MAGLTGLLGSFFIYKPLNSLCKSKTLNDSTLCSIHRSQRRIWTKAGLGIEDFPLEANCRHLRKSRNASIIEDGSAKLQEAAPDLLNHLPSTNRQGYILSIILPPPLKKSGV